MALSGSFYTSTYTGISPSRPRRIYVKWSATQNIANNTSTITVTCSAEGSSGTDWVTAGPVRVYINGSLVVNSTGRFNISKGDSIPNGSESITVTHNSDGTKSVSVKAEAAIYSSSINSTYSGTITLNTIPRTSSISSISPSTVAVGASPAITWKPSSSSFKYKIDITCNGEKYNTVSFLSCKTQDFGSDGTVTSTTKWDGTNLTFNAPTLKTAFGEAIPNATSASATCKLYTYSSASSSALVGTATKGFTISIPSSWIPTLNTFTATLDNSENSTVSSWGIAVAGYSKIKLSGTATGIHKSTIKSFVISGGYSGTITGTSLSYTINSLSAGTKTFTCVAKDSRGRSSSSKTSGSFTVYEYHNPSITSFSISRNSSDSRKMDAQIIYDYTTVNNKNSATATIYYQESGNSSWTKYGTIKQNQVNTISGFEETKSYNFRVVVEDSLGNSDEQTAFVSTIGVLMDFRAGGKGLAIGKISEHDGFEVAMDSTFKNPVTIDPDVMSSTPSLNVVGDIKYNTFSGVMNVDNGILQVIEGNKLLWEGAHFMQGSQIITLSESALDQQHGVALCWSGYNTGEGAQEWGWSVNIIPKYLAQLKRGGYSFFMCAGLGSPFAFKYIYWNDDDRTQIIGHDYNIETGTSSCGIKYNNNRFVLRYVVGF